MIIPLKFPITACFWITLNMTLEMEMTLENCSNSQGKGIEAIIHFSGACMTEGSNMQGINRWRYERNRKFAARLP